MVDSSMNETEQRFLRNHAIEFAPALQHPRGDAYTSDLRQFSFANSKLDSKAEYAPQDRHNALP